jgi:hypothetical protein
MMDDVYRRARRVTIWLGPETSDSDSGMRYLQALGSQVDINLLKMHITPRYEEARDLADRYRVLEISSAQTKSVLGLIQREWFERLWIRQEVYLSEDAAVVLCGRVEVPWKDFLSSLVLLHLKPKVGPGMTVSMVNSLEARLVELRGLLESERKPSLHRLRQCFGNAKCKDPRDRIFAVLGLLHPSQKRLKIFPDYKATKAEVYIRVTLSYLRAFQLADILVECHLHADLNFPSWAPDWSKTSKIKNHRIMTFASSLALAQFEIDEIKGVLRLAGVPVSTLEEVGPLSDPLDNNANPLAYVKRICEMEDGLFNIRDNVKSNSEEHFLQTVCVNHANLYYPPSNDFPDLGQVKAIILELMRLTNLVDDGTLLVHDNHVKGFLSQANSMLNGRRLSQTSLGLPALVPDSARSRDVVCVLLGCEAPMLLRPVGTTGNFRVVGQCFMPNIAHGEALLGPLPPHIRFVWATNIASGERWGFLDDRTGQYSRWDPRLDLLPIDLEEGRRYLDQNKDKYIYSNLGVELLRQHGTSWDGTKGVNMQFFDLI